jgi:pimeloyl-ACP methyl ester carboxylesterase
VRTESRALFAVAFASLIAAVGVSMSGQTAPPLTATTVPTTLVTGTLKDSTKYTLAKPDPWNGTVFVDLDSLGMNADYSNWLYAHGIARAGITREHVGSLMDHAAANLVEALDIFTAKFGQPKRAIVWGNSLGGQAAAVAAFRYPDRFAAALPHCGGLMGWPAYLNTNLDVAFVLKTLIDPNADLPLVHIPEDDAALNQRWQALLEKAQQTPEGRARIALAVAIGRAPMWTSRDQTEPAADDAAGREAAAYRTVLDFSRQFTALRRRLETPAGGATSWNAGVNYTELYAAAAPLERQTVEALYRQAGRALADDLGALATAPRIAAEPGPIDFVRRLYPFDGKIRIPVLGMSSTGDPYVWSAIDGSYAAAVHAAGKDDLLRLTYVHSAGHCAFNGAERVATFEVLLERLDTGRWPDTSPAALNKRAADAHLADARFWNFTAPPPRRAELVPNEP